MKPADILNATLIIALIAAATTTAIGLLILIDLVIENGWH